METHASRPDSTSNRAFAIHLRASDTTTTEFDGEASSYKALRFYRGDEYVVLRSDNHYIPKVPQGLQSLLASEQETLLPKVHLEGLCIFRQISVGGSTTEHKTNLALKTNLNLYPPVYSEPASPCFWIKGCEAAGDESSSGAFNGRATRGR